MIRADDAAAKRAGRRGAGARPSSAGTGVTADLSPPLPGAALALSLALALALPLALLSSSGCPDPGAGATGVDLTVIFDERLPLDQLEVAFALDGEPAFEPQRAPAEPAPLDPTGARPFAFLLSDELAGQDMTLFVDGLAGGEAQASGDVTVALVAGARVAARVELGALAFCGDGEVRAGREVCDDGNTGDGDGCSAACAVEPGFVCDDGAPSSCAPLTPCGDGTIDAGEQCDDGNTGDDDGCGALCTVEPGWVCVGQPSSCARTCGDGDVDLGEVCDDGDVSPGDGCDGACAVELGFVCVGEPSLCAQTCGDGGLDTGEACDDGGLLAGDGCTGSCALETGFTCAGQPSACAPLCGDGFVRGSELCDDGAATAGDGCDAACRPEPGFSCSGEPSLCANTCGDGALAAGEACDDGDVDAGDGCTATCTVEAGFSCSGEPSLCAQTCGDGALDSGEVCDDGNAGAGDGCTATCTVEVGFACADGLTCAPVCGDGLLRGAEGCDDADTAAGDGCTDACAIEAGFACAGQPSVCAQSCGDGDVDAGEGCDDATLTDGDGCSAACAVELGYSCSGAPSVCAQTCGDGAVDAGEACDDGGTAGGDGCSAGCAAEPGFACPPAGGACTAVCGDRLLRGAETCDDGDTDGGDGCSASCARESGFLCTGEPSVCVPGCLIGGSGVAEGTPDPTNPCRACRSTIDANAYSAVVNGTSCEDGAFCNGQQSCTAGQCGGGAPPCGGTTPVCVESADACACAGASCDDGAFCNGAEICASGPVATCAPGQPPVCPPPSDFCSELLDRCVECQTDAQCAAPNPSCVNERCVACPTCACPAGEHDGGDGVCRPDGTCSSGFGIGFIDADLDGFGAPSFAPACFPLPLAAGVSSVGTDCNDGDGAVFEIEALFFDDDLDGFTLESAQPDCVGDALPLTRSRTARPPPFAAFEPATATNVPDQNGRDWTKREGAQHLGQTVAETGDMSNGTFSDFLVLTSYGLSIPSNATIVGVRVHLVRRADRSNGILDRSIRLAQGGVAVGIEHAAGGVGGPATWPTALTDAVYGSPTDLWGVALTPAIVNSAGFGLVVQATSVAGNGSARAQVDGAWLEIFTTAGGDCNDVSSAVFTATAGRIDADADGHSPVPSVQTFCIGGAMPAGVSQQSLGVDCFDASFSAHLGQTQFFSTNRGDGSFDYDCVNGEEREPVAEDTGCTCLVLCFPLGAATYVPTATCGTPTQRATCQGSCSGSGGPTCAVSTTPTTTTRCR